MEKRTKVIVIISGLIILIAGTVIYKLVQENENHTKNYPYPQLYDAFEKRCPSLLDGEYIETPTPFETYGHLTIDGYDQKYAVRVAVEKYDDEKYFSAYFDSNQFNIGLETENMYAIRYDMKEHKLMNVNNYQEITPSLKSAFEEEMKKRLESC